MVHNPKNVVGLTKKTSSMVFTIYGGAISGMGKVEKRDLCYKEFNGMPAADLRIRFGIKGR